MGRVLTSHIGMSIARTFSSHTQLTHSQLSVSRNWFFIHFILFIDIINKKVSFLFANYFDFNEFLVVTMKPETVNGRVPDRPIKILLMTVICTNKIIGMASCFCCFCLPSSLWYQSSCSHRDTKNEKKPQKI